MIKCVHVRSKGYTPKLPEFDLTTDTEYVANLVNANIDVVVNNSAVYYVGMVYLHNDIFLTDMTGHDRLKFR